jgi:hypothetical protein
MPTVICKCYSWCKVPKYPLVLPVYTHSHNSFRPYFGPNVILYVSRVADSTPEY